MLPPRPSAPLARESPATDDNRECTDACLANDCNLDEQGFCTDAMWPALDFDLYPCPAGADDCDPKSLVAG